MSDAPFAHPVRAAMLTLRLPHVSTGLGTILFGVSGNCDDREVTSLPEEFPKEPDSEKDTCRSTNEKIPEELQTTNLNLMIKKMYQMLESRLIQVSL